MLHEPIASIHTPREGPVHHGDVAGRMRRWQPSNGGVNSPPSHGPFTLCYARTLATWIAIEAQFDRANRILDDLTAGRSPLHGWLIAAAQSAAVDHGSVTRRPSTGPRSVHGAALHGCLGVLRAVHLVTFLGLRVDIGPIMASPQVPRAGQEADRVGALVSRRHRLNFYRWNCSARATWKKSDNVTPTRPPRELARRQGATIFVARRRRPVHLPVARPRAILTEAVEGSPRTAVARTTRAAPSITGVTGSAVASRYWAAEWPD